MDFSNSGTAEAERQRTTRLFTRCDNVRIHRQRLSRMAARGVETNRLKRASSWLRLKRHAKNVRARQSRAASELPVESHSPPTPFADTTVACCDGLLHPDFNRRTTSMSCIWT